MKNILLLIYFLLCTAAASALVVQPPDAPGILSGGYAPSADDWNNGIRGAYTYVNTYIVAPLNRLTAKGDLYVYNGESLAAESVGADDTVLLADSTAATGTSWGTTTGLQPLTTKGDIEVCDGSTIQRVGAGTNGYALLARPSAATGVAWESLANSEAYPAGSVIAWSPTFAGTGVPSGWAVCDGTGGRPNMIGRFILGTRPNGSAASPSAGGYGAQSVDAKGTGAAGHAQTFSLNVTDGSGGTDKVSTTAGSTEVLAGAGATVAGGHNHTLSSQIASAAGNNEQPSDYALIYLMKL